MAEATGLTRGAICFHLKQIYRRLRISRQADLFRMVLSISPSWDESDANRGGHLVAQLLPELSETTLSWGSSGRRPT